MGFEGEDSTGKWLIKALKLCKQEIEKSGKLTPALVSTLKHQALTHRIESKFNHTGTQNNLLSLTLLDVLNPCSLFGLLGFLALIFMQNRPRTQLVTGLFFIATFGLMHYFQQVNPLLYFEILSWMRVPAFFIGLYMLYLVRLEYLNLTSTEPLKLKTHGPTLYLSAILMALMIGFYQQSCLKNWSYLFEQWLNHQNYSSIQRFWYEFSYQILYLLPSLLLLFGYTFFINLKAWPRLKIKLHSVGLIFMIIFGFILIIYPQTLNNFILSLITLLAMIIGSRVFTPYLRTTD